MLVIDRDEDSCDARMPFLNGHTTTNWGVSFCPVLYPTSSA
jgi:hypothetical protein